MTAINFAYWMQSLFEVADLKTLNEKQVQIIKNHLNMVFAHDIDPKLGDKTHQEKLDKLHEALKDTQKYPPSWDPGVLIKC